MDEAVKRRAQEAAARILVRTDDVLMALITVEVQRITGKHFKGEEDNEVYQVIKEEIKRVYEAW